jgi:hypothetical protein
MQQIIQQLINHIGQLRLRCRGAVALTPAQADVCDQAVAQARQLLATLNSAPDETNPVQIPEMNFTYHCGEIPNCQPLRVFRDFSNRQAPRITSAWQLSRAALDQVIASGGVVYLSVLQPNQPAVWLDGFHGITPELQAACAFPNGGEPAVQVSDPEAFGEQKERSKRELATAFIAGLLRALGYQPSLIEPDGVFIQPHVENIGTAALDFFALHPSICNDETVAAICGRNDTLFRSMDGYQPLRQALESWTDDGRIVIAQTGNEAQAAVDALISEALPPVQALDPLPAPGDLGQYYLDAVSRSLGLGYQPTKPGLSSPATNRWRHQLQAAALDFFSVNMVLFTQIGLAQFGKLTCQSDVPRLFQESVYFLPGFANLADGVIGYRIFLSEETTRWRESKAFRLIESSRGLVDMLLDQLTKQQEAGNDLPASVIADQALATAEAQELLAAYIAEYCDQNRFPENYWFDPALFMRWFKAQPYSGGIAESYLAAIESAVAKVADQRRDAVRRNRKVTTDPDPEGTDQLRQQLRQEDLDAEETLSSDQLRERHGLDPESAQDYDERTGGHIADAVGLTDEELDDLDDDEDPNEFRKHDDA